MSFISTIIYIESIIDILNQTNKLILIKLYLKLYHAAC